MADAPTVTHKDNVDPDPKISVTPPAPESRRLDNEVAKPPEGIPEKFWNPETKQVDQEKLLKSYAELEKKLSASKTPETPKPTEAPKDGEKPPEEATPDGDPKADLKTAMEAAQAEYAEKAALTPETKGALAEKLGVSAEDVDAWIAGQEVIANRLLAEVGGKEGFETLKAWAAKNVPAEDLKAYDAVMSDPKASLATKKLALQGIHAKYKDAEGYEGNAYGGGSSGPGDVFESQAAQTAALADPRYNNDHAYTAQVRAKFLRTAKRK